MPELAIAAQEYPVGVTAEIPGRTTLRLREYVARLATPIVAGAVVWHTPSPPGIAAESWHFMGVFVGTIVAIVARPLPTGAVALVALVFSILIGTLPVADAMAGFGNPVVWLVVAAFFIATSFIRTGLGLRIAYHFLRLLGKRTLGLAYGLVATDLLLAPAIPSNTARAGGVIFPILKSLGTSLGSDASLGTSRRVSAFLTVTAYQATVITSAMFVTAMVANPMILELAGQQGMAISWTSWAVAASVPGLSSLLLVPLLIYRVYPPEMKETPNVAREVDERLARLGPISSGEIILLAVFLSLIGLWIFGTELGVHTTAAAMAGVGTLLLSRTLQWDDVLQERGAWDTLIWFAVLVMMAQRLDELGLVGWLGNGVAAMVEGLHWIPAFLVLVIVYFYTHYFFASNTAHVAAMYSPFLAVALAVGVPPLLAALALAFSSNLFASLTHYGTAAAPVLFGSGNVEIGMWWKLGFLASVLNITVWLGIGGLWWRVLGLW